MNESATPAQIDRLLVDSSPRVAELVSRLRSLIRSLIDGVEERVYFGWRGIGFHHPDAGYVCALFPRDDEVRVGFEHGHLLHDPFDRLTGTGSRVRYLPVAAWDDELPGIVAGFVDQAIHLP